MDERGLASMYAEEQGVGMAPMQQKVAPASVPVPTIEEIVALLKQGITPQELIQQGTGTIDNDLPFDIITALEIFIV